MAGVIGANGTLHCGAGGRVGGFEGVMWSVVCSGSVLPPPYSKECRLARSTPPPPLQPPFRRTQSSDSAAQTVSPLLPLPLTEAAMPRSAKRRSFVISLDAPPETRWREVLRAFKPQITAMLLASEDLQAFDNLGPSARFACRKLLLALPEEQRREVGSAAEELGVDLHVAAASQVLYD